jgi:hypothetical protein
MLPELREKRRKALQEVHDVYDRHVLVSHLIAREHDL